MDNIDLSGLSSDESVKLLKKAIEVLESIDTSIDFLAAAMTGMEPLDIELGQRAIGRLQRPFRPKGVPLDTKTGETEMRENIKISEALIEEIMEEEIKAMLEQDADPAPWLSKDAENSRERSWRPPLPEPYDVALGDYEGPYSRPRSALLDLIDDPDLETALAAREAASLNLNHPDDPGDLWLAGIGSEFAAKLAGGTIDTPRSPTGPKKQIRPGEEGFRPGEVTYRDRLEEIIEEEVRKLLEKTK
jgi:hypothetical protein